MTLYDYMKGNHIYSHDFWDTQFDECVTVVFVPDEEANRDYTDQFVNNLLHKVEVKTDDDSDDLFADWSGLIKRNMTLFRLWARENWRWNRGICEDDFILEWIQELHLLCSGYGTDNGYRKLVNQLVRHLDGDGFFFTEDELWSLRRECRLGSLYLGDYNNSLFIDPHVLCDFFDGYLDYLEELMEDDDENYDDSQFFDKLDDYDNPENLMDWYQCLSESPFITREEL